MLKVALITGITWSGRFISGRIPARQGTYGSRADPAGKQRGGSRRSTSEISTSGEGKRAIETGRFG